MKVESTLCVSMEGMAKFELRVDGELALKVWDGEIEDNNLGRNFNDILSIEGILKRAHKAGARGEDFILTHKEEEWV